MILKLISAASGYYIGLGIEAAVALVAGVLLVLLLANVFVKNEDEEEQPEPAGTALVPLDDQSGTKEDKKAKKKAKGEVVDQDTVAAVPYSDTGSTEVKEHRTIINVYNIGTPNQTEKPEEKEPVTATKVEVEEPEKAQEKEKEDAIKFAEASKTITELYDELTPEQRRFFDELKNRALSKPKAVLSVTKNYESVKVGKQSILKLLIRKGVVVAEFLLESDALKEYRKHSENKKGKSRIRIRPTVIAVTDLDTLKTALDMINLAHEQLFDD